MLDADVLVDALFGSGGNRALAGDAAAWVRQANASRLRILALDVPSGVDADTGHVPGEHPAITAVITRAAQDQDALRLRPRLQELAPGGLAGAAHQGGFIDAVGGLGAAFDLAQCSVGVKRGRP